MEGSSKDVVAWLQHCDKTDKGGMLLFRKQDLSVVTVQAKLVGNVFGYWEGHKAFDASSDSAAVCGCALLERCAIELCDASAELPYAFCINFSSTCALNLSAFCEDDREQWVKFMSIASLEMKLAELHAADEVNRPVPLSTAPTGPFLNCSHQTFSFPPLQCHEAMFESRLSMTLPHQFLTHMLRCTEGRIDLFMKSLIYLPKKYQELKMDHVSHLRQRIKLINESIASVDAHSGFFKKSVCKDDHTLSFCPTNIHLEKFTVQDGRSESMSYSFLTGGACSAFSSGYNEGGLLRQLQDFSANMSSENVDCFDESKLTARIATVEKVRKEVASMKFELDTKEVAENGERYFEKLERNLNKLEDCKERCFQFVAQLPRIELTMQKMKSLSISAEEKDQEKENGSEGEDFLLVAEQLQTQATDLEAYFASLSSKLTAIKGLSTTPDKEWVASAKNAALHVCECIRRLAISIRDALVFDMLAVLRNRTGKHYELQTRLLMCLCQAISTSATAILSKLYETKGVLPAEVKLWPYLGPAISTLSHLSCIGQEQGMLEDQLVAWQKLCQQCSFRIICPFSSIRPSSCIPIVEGDLSNFVISLPVTENVFTLLPQRLKNGGLFRVHPIVWNMGVNHEAFLSSVTGSCVLEKDVNQIALSQTHKYVHMLKNVLEDADDSQLCPLLFTRASSLYISLSDTLNKGPAEKNMKVAVLWIASDWCRTVGGITVFCCKSGKDRTGMAATLEEAQLLRRNHGLGEPQMQHVLDELRKKGVRRENCRKNVGAPCYSFSSLQVRLFLPSEYKPPNGTYKENYLT